MRRTAMLFPLGWVALSQVIGILTGMVLANRIGMRTLMPAPRNRGCSGMAASCLVCCSLWVERRT